MSAISRAIREHLAVWPLFGNAEEVLLYHPFRNEVDFMPLAERFSGKAFFLPRVEAEDRMRFFRYHPGDPLETGKYGIPEPAPAGHPWRPNNRKSLVLLPALMFDRHGYRLGYGKGYYDRFLEALGADAPGVVLAGGVPEALCCGRLPRDSWDRPVAYVITENTIHACPQAQA